MCGHACHVMDVPAAGLEDEDEEDVGAPAPRHEQGQDREMDDGFEEEDEFADFLDYDDEGGAPGEGRRRRPRQGLPPGVSSAALAVSHPAVDFDDQTQRACRLRASIMTAACILHTIPRRPQNDDHFLQKLVSLFYHNSPIPLDVRGGMASHQYLGCLVVMLQVLLWFWKVADWQMCCTAGGAGDFWGCE